MIEANTGEWVAEQRWPGPLWGAWSVRHSAARKMYHCDDCYRLIFTGDTYWRRFGKMAEAIEPWVSRLCERCEEKWRHH